MKEQISRQLPVNVVSYLNKYTVDGWSLEINPNRKFKLVIVIPAIAEYNNIKTVLNSLLENISLNFKSTSVLFVVNNMINSTGEVKAENRETVLFLRGLINETAREKNLIEHLRQTGLTIGLIDACSDGKELPKKTGGVGLARKIGMDLSLTLFDYSSPLKNIIACLDADCTVEKNYIDTIINSFNGKNVHAAVTAYEHKLPQNEEIGKAITCYELFLRYFSLGLKYAGSPFAYHSIGSTIVCTADAYIKVQGMNKKKAGEDFYFLEKLAKNYKVNKLSSTKVYPASRPSWRVPFGTGQRINRYLTNTADEYSVYSFKIFEVLKKWNELFFKREILTAEKYLTGAKKISSRLNEFLVKSYFEEDWNRIKSNAKSEQQVWNQKISWFDAFKTLKLIHHLRDNEFGNQNLFSAVLEMLKSSGQEYHAHIETEIPALDQQIKLLYHTRNIDNLMEF